VRRIAAQMHTCYLLRSARGPRKSYVGYAPNVAARLEAHNGKRPGGARAMQKFRPWEVFARVSGFAA
jgi:structure-specific endonuclease subunit SLX1